MYRLLGIMVLLHRTVIQSAFYILHAQRTAKIKVLLRKSRSHDSVVFGGSPYTCYIFAVCALIAPPPAPADSEHYRRQNSSHNLQNSFHSNTSRTLYTLLSEKKFYCKDNFKNSLLKNLSLYQKTSHRAEYFNIRDLWLAFHILATHFRSFKYRHRQKIEFI